MVLPLGCGAAASRTVWTQPIPPAPSFLMKFTPHDYQRFSISWMIQRTMSGEQGSALFLDPGLGKTSITLSWFNALRMLGKARRALIIAPLRVVYSVWPQEIAKWDQFDFTHSIIHGTQTERQAALDSGADISLINPEGVQWLGAALSLRDCPFDTLIVDESSKFKSWSAKRTKALRLLLKRFKNRVILTGTPSPNSVVDLFPQIYICDRGAALGENISQFRSRYCYRGGYAGHSWLPVDGADQIIQDRISDITLRLSAEDHLDLPDCLYNDVWVDMPAEQLTKYKRLERKMLFELSEVDSITPLNGGAKYNQCKQIANGGIYDSEKKYHFVHDAKTEALVDLVEELQGKPVLVAYQYRHDLERIRKAFPKCPHIGGDTSPKQCDSLVSEWNAGKLPILAVQPASLSHGVNMQSGPGRDIVWYGLTDNLEYYEQLNKRIHRQGVTGLVRIHHLLTRYTVDVAVADRIREKAKGQQALLDALKKYRKHVEGI